MTFTFSGAHHTMIWEKVVAVRHLYEDRPLTKYTPMKGKREITT